MAAASKEVEFAHHAAEEHNSRKLHAQSHHQHVHADLHRAPLPVPRTRYPGARHLDQECDDVGDDEDLGEFAERDAVDVRDGSGEDGEAEAREQEVVACCYEEGCKDD